jgi:hypothetical protein
MDDFDVFLLGNVDTFQSIDDFVESLRRFLEYGCYIDEYGRVAIARQLVGRVDGLRMEVFPRDHNPPHFHVRANGIDAKFDLVSCELLSGKVGRREYEKIRYWHDRTKEQLRAVWQNTRPGTPEGKNRH